MLEVYIYKRYKSRYIMTIRRMKLMRSPSSTLIGHLLIQLYARGHVVFEQLVYFNQYCKEQNKSSKLGTWLSKPMLISKLFSCATRF